MLYCKKGYTLLSQTVVVLDGTNCGLHKVRRYSQLDPVSENAGKAFMTVDELVNEAKGQINYHGNRERIIQLF